MANFFDQFDVKPATGTATGNFFDQFDEGPAAPAPSAPLPVPRPTGLGASQPVIPAPVAPVAPPLSDLRSEDLRSARGFGKSSPDSGLRPEEYGPYVVGDPTPPAPQAPNGDPNDPWERAAAEKANRSQIGLGFETGVTGMQQIGSGVGSAFSASQASALRSTLDTLRQSRADLEQNLRARGLPDDVFADQLSRRGAGLDAQIAEAEATLSGVESNKRMWADAIRRYALEMQSTQGRVPNFTDISDVRDFTDWAAFNIGQGAPFIAAAVGAGIAGGPVGLAAFGYGVGVGDIQAQLVEAGVEDAPEIAAVAAVPYAALEFLGPAGRTVRGHILRNVGHEAAQEVAEAWLKRAGKAITANAVEEFINEAGQEIIADYAVAAGTGKPVEMSGDTLKKWFNAGMAGFIVGAPMGVLEAGGRRTDAEPVRMPTPATSRYITPEDDASPLRNDLIEQGKKIIDDIVKGGQGLGPAPARTAPSALPPDAGSVPAGSVPLETLYPARPAVSTEATQPSEGDGTGKATQPSRDVSAAPAAPTAEDSNLAPEDLPEPAPTDGQKEAGNFRKGHIAWQGLDLTIETAKGQERSGTDADGERWSVTMPADYGYIKRTEGKDGDHVDIYLGGVPDSDHVVIINQVDAGTGKFDEHKVILGTISDAQALNLYRQGFSDGKADQRIGSYTATTVAQFKAWLESGSQKKPTEPITMPFAAREPAPRETQAALPSASETQAAPAQPTEPAPTLVTPGRAPTSSRPTSLLRMLANAGGLKDFGGELRAMNAELWHRQPREKGEVGYRPKLVKGTGMSISRAAERAFEAGYIADKEDNTLLDAIRAELEGKRVIAQADINAEQDWQAAQRGAEDQRAADAQREAAREAVVEHIDREWPNLKMTDAEISVVVDSVMEGADIDSAIERVIVENVDNAAEQANEPAEDIPFPDIPADRAQGPGREAGPVAEPAEAGAPEDAAVRPRDQQPAERAERVGSGVTDAEVVSEDQAPRKVGKYGFEAPRTEEMRAFIEKERRRVIGLSYTNEGVFIHTDPELWVDGWTKDPLFYAKSNGLAIDSFYKRGSVPGLSGKIEPKWRTEPAKTFRIDENVSAILFNELGPAREYAERKGVYAEYMDAPRSDGGITLTGEQAMLLTAVFRRYVLSHPRVKESRHRSAAAFFLDLKRSFSISEADIKKHRFVGAFEKTTTAQVWIEEEPDKAGLQRRVFRRAGDGYEWTSYGAYQADGDRARWFAYGPKELPSSIIEGDEAADPMAAFAEAKAAFSEADASKKIADPEKYFALSVALGKARDAAADHLAARDEGGVVLRNASSTLGAMITKNTTGADPWRITYFDSRGFSGDRAFKDKSAAVRDAMREGYDTEDRGFLNKLRSGWDKAEPPASFDAKPSEAKQGEVGMKLAEGEVVRTTTGRLTTPFPKITGGSERKALNTQKRVETWLMVNAFEEATARGDEYNARMFEAQIKNPSQSDKDSAEYYLFDPNFNFPVRRSILKPLGLSESAGEPAVGPSSPRASEPSAETASPAHGAALRAAMAKGEASHVTQKGKTLSGYVVTGLDKGAAQEIDRFTFKKGDGFFVRKAAADAYLSGEPQAAPAKGAGVTVKLETVYDDGSYTALLDHYGREYSVNFINGDLSIRRTNPNQYERTPAWKRDADVKAVSDHAWAKIMAQGEDFIAKHRALYELGADTPIGPVAAVAAVAPATRATERFTPVVTRDRVKSPGLKNDGSDWLSYYEMDGRLYGAVYTYGKTSAWEQSRREGLSYGDPMNTVPAPRDPRGRRAQQIAIAKVAKLHTERAEADQAFIDRHDEILGDFLRQQAPAEPGPDMDRFFAREKARGKIVSAPADKKAAAKLRSAGEAALARGEEKFGQDRNTNTARRARMAASAEAEAQTMIRRAKTALAIADLIEAGNAGPLVGVTSLADIEALDRALRTAQVEAARLMPNQEWSARNARDAKMRGDMPVEEGDIASAREPQVWVWPRDLAEVLEKLGKANLAERSTLKKLGNAYEHFGTSREDHVRAIAELVRVAKAKGLGSNYAVKKFADELREFNRWGNMGATSQAQRMALLKAYLAVRSGQKAPTVDPMVEARRKLIGTKIPGFFETPVALASRMVDEAGLRPGEKVLEPSAGAGRIANAAAEIVGKENVDVIEINSTLREILQTQGFEPVSSDFTGYAGGPEGGYDVILMNPPFENRQDAEHVRRAFDLLRPGGRLVSIMGEGVFFGSDKKATEFRAWIESLGAEGERLPAGTFEESGTGTNTRIIRIDKPEAAKAIVERPAAKRPAEDTGPDGGTQTVIPGTERITDKELAERRMQGAKKATATQKAPGEDGGLFDTGERNQQDLFDRPAKPRPTAPEPKPAEAAKPEPTGKIEDFGEKITGAAKDRWREYAERLDDVADGEITTEPLSKIFPAPDYAALIADGVDPWSVAFIRAAREMIPNKPRQPWKLRGWVAQVTILRDFAKGILSGTYTKKSIEEKWGRAEFARLRSNITDTLDLYLAVGHERSLKDIGLTHASYSVRNGVRHDPPLTVWEVTQKARKTAFSNMPRVLSEGATREAAIKDFKKKIAGMDAPEKQAREVRLNLWLDRSTSPFTAVIGKKIGSAYVPLQRFDTVKEARAYLAAHQEELEAKLERMKDIRERRDTNSPRVGIDHRDGGDVTPEQFTEAFGFRGVQFGNYVEGGKRQNDLNQAYDALMDLAGVLDIDPKALSLNGELGLAFGARGHGGKNAPAAHYEPGQIVINLTKRAGAGSLAHEWFHGVDNYFERMRGRSSRYITDQPAATEVGKVRPEVLAAFVELRRAIDQTALKTRSAKLDRLRSKPYWATGIEMHARAFESYVIAKLQDGGYSNDYLANIVDERMFEAESVLAGREASSYPYPIASEVPAIRAGFDNLFQTIEARKTDRGVALFSKQTSGQTTAGDEYADVPVGSVVYISRPEATAAIESVKAALRVELDRLGLPNIRLNVVEKMQGKNQDGSMVPVNGHYANGIISVALNSDIGRIPVLQHETGHALLDPDLWGAPYGLFRPAEYHAALRKANADKALVADVAERYAGWPENVIQQERIMALFEKWRQGQFEPTGFVKAAFERIAAFFEALGNALRGNGFTTADQMFRRMLSGEIGLRQGGEAIGASMTPKSMFSATEAPIYHSPLLRALSGAKQRSATAGDWKAIIAKLPGVKKIEIEWLGVNDWLDAQTGQVPREAVEEFVRLNQVQVQTDVLGEDVPDYALSDPQPIEPDWAEEADIYMDDARDELGDDADESDVAERAEEIARENWDESSAEHSVTLYDRNGIGPEYDGIYFEGGYNFLDLGGDITDPVDVANARSERDHAQWPEDTEPGGENYREILLRMPNLHETGRNAPATSPAKTVEELINRPTRKRPFVQPHHFAQENIVVHARVKDRLDTAGRKVLFVEEIQSDLASKWREATESPEVTARRRELKSDQAAQAEEFRTLLPDAEKTVKAYMLDTFANQVFAGYEAGEAVKALFLAMSRGNETGNRAAIVARAALRERDGEMYDKIKTIAKRRRDTDAELLRLGTEKTIDPTVPETPFQGELSYKLMVKRLLREAADKGYDKLAWTPGYMQAERWNHAAQSVVERVTWVRRTDPDEGSVVDVDLYMAGGGGTHNFIADGTTGQFIYSNIDAFDDKGLRDLLGPTMARQMLSEPRGDMDGQRITFPDSGYAIAYDQQVKRAVNDFARKFGGRVVEDKSLKDMADSFVTERAQIAVIEDMGFDAALERARSVLYGSRINDNARGRNDASLRSIRDEENWAERFAGIARSLDYRKMDEAFPSQPEGKPVWSVEITPEMRSAARLSQPMFSRQRPDAEQRATDQTVSGFAEEQLSGAVSHETSIERRQHSFLNTIATHPVDAAFRIPFMLVGGLDNAGRWKYGKAAEGRIRRVVTEQSFGFMDPLVNRVRAGMIDRWGLPEDYVERERARGVDESLIAAEGKEFLEALKAHGLDAREAKVLQAVLTGEAVADADMANLSEPIRNAIDRLGLEAVEIGLLSRESYERNKGRYLHRVYQKHEVETGAFEKWMTKVITGRRRKIQGDQFKGRGLFEEVAANRIWDDNAEYKDARRGKPQLGDKVIILDLRSTTGTEAFPDIGGPRGKLKKRIYWPAERPIPARFDNYESRGTFDVRGARGDNLILWRDFTKDERLKMGEILDARYTIAKTYALMAHDLATGRFFKDIAENEEWSRATPPPDAVVDEDASDRAWLKRMWVDPSVEWVHVPKAKIGKSDTYRYGALAGRYVRADIWRDMEELRALQTPWLWQRLMTQWKLNKTARNPVVHMNNIMSNFMLMDMADVRIPDLVAGVRSLAKKDAAYREALTNGAFGGDLVTQEFRQDVLAPLLQEIADEMRAGKGGLEAEIGAIGKFADALIRAVKKIDGAMIQAYQLEDQVFRMATYIRRRQQGYDAKEAAVEARDQFLNYDIRAPWINAARRSLLPFISYTYRAVPKIAQTVAERPWKIAKYFAIYQAANALSYSLAPSDDDEERERKSMREQEQGYTWVGAERMVRMPYLSDGNPVFLDVRRWIPAGDVFDLGGGDLPAWLHIGGPLVIGMEMYLNRAAFTGDDIVNPLTDTAAERTQKRAEFLYRSWMPSAPWVPGSWYFDKIKRAAEGAALQPGSNKPYALSEAILSSMGIKLKPIDVEVGYRWRMVEFEKEAQELKAQESVLKRQFQRRQIDAEEYASGRERLGSKMERLRARMREVFGQ